ncbi:MAG TPA: CDP-alcohol phosphatidyltransferase family protein [Candidatus Nanoarchaeia archaeon]|nr:CDP-alcohol phosphatidyltransferase family protein [Candidatus Nanoarchaeia archaeon]
MVESIKELREICYKDSKGRRPLYMEWVTMKISIFVTKLLLYTPIKADQVTIGMVLLAILGSVFMAFGTLKFLLIGILIIHFTVILDNVNGEVARYRKEGSMMGTFLEQYYHELSVPLIFFGLGFGVFLATGYKSAVIFGFLCGVFSRSTVLSALKSAVVKNAIRDRKNNKVDEKLKKYYLIAGKSPNVEGGSTETGAKLYHTYDFIREFWSAPFNIFHINVLVILEILNKYYWNALPQYAMLYWYLVIYGSVSVLIQLISFIVHYKGNTIYHYYVAMLGKGKK